MAPLGFTGVNRDKAQSDGVFPRCPEDIAMTLDGDFLASM